LLEPIAGDVVAAGALGGVAGARPRLGDRPRVCGGEVLAREDREQVGLLLLGGRRGLGGGEADLGADVVLVDREPGGDGGAGARSRSASASLALPRPYSAASLVASPAVAASNALIAPA